MKNIYYLCDFCLFSQIIIMERRRNYLMEIMGAEDWESYEKAEEFMCEKAHDVLGERDTPDTVSYEGIATLENGTFTDLLANPKSSEVARNISIWWSNERAEYVLTWEEIAEISYYFEQLVERFPELMDEFRENGLI